MAIVDLSQTGTNKDDGYEEHPIQYQFGPVPFKHTATIATTHIDNADDGFLLFEFPEEACWLDLDSLVILPSDLDTGATPALDVDYGIGDSDGTLDTQLIDGSLAGQTGVADFVDNADGEGFDTARTRFLSVAGKYLLGDVVTAAATAAAGTIEVSGVYYMNLKPTTASV